MILQNLRDLLLTVTPNVFHYEPPDGQNGNYIVWAEDGEDNSFHADEQKSEQTLTGTIDYFTKDEFDPVFDLIQEKLNSADIAWYLNSIQYEEDTGYIHYEWVWELV